MQRLCSKLRSLTLQIQSTQALSSSRRLLHSSSQIQLASRFVSSNESIIRRSLFSNSRSSTNRMFYPSSAFVPPTCSSQSPVSLVQVRHVSSRERKKRRKPMTPVKSKVKKIKMKFYSSYKSRFKALNDGTIRRWREGKNHNAHGKSPKAKRRLRQPALVPAAYAKVMKKLGFCA